MASRHHSRHRKRETHLDAMEPTVPEPSSVYCGQRQSVPDPSETPTLWARSVPDPSETPTPLARPASRCCSWNGGCAVGRCRNRMTSRCAFVDSLRRRGDHIAISTPTDHVGARHRHPQCWQARSVRRDLPRFAEGPLNMITRRTAALAATGILFAPAVVRAESLMHLCGILIPPVEPVHLGFVDRADLPII
jgi:hypothetical protein